MKIDFSQNYRGVTRPGFKDGTSADMKKMMADFHAGNPVFVEFNMSGSHRLRNGSIAQITKIKHPPLGALPHYLASIEIEVGWHGRSNLVKANLWDVYWLQGHTGPTNYIYNRPAPLPAVKVKDRLGREMKVGDFVCYILHHFDGNMGAATYFGKVTKVTPKGKVFAKNIKIASTDYVDTKEIKDPSQAIILTKDLMDQLTLVKLSTI